MSGKLTGWPFKELVNNDRGNANSVKMGVESEPNKNVHVVVMYENMGSTYYMEHHVLILFTPPPPIKMIEWTFSL